VLNQVSQTSSAEIDIIATARKMYDDEMNVKIQKAIEK